MKLLIFCLLWYTIFNAWLSGKAEEDTFDNDDIRIAGIVVNYILAACMVVLWLISWFWPPVFDLIRGIL